jgi:hypothetical protein
MLARSPNSMPERSLHAGFTRPGVHCSQYVRGFGVAVPLIYFVCVPAAAVVVSCSALCGNLCSMPREQCAFASMLCVLVSCMCL